MPEKVRVVISVADEQASDLSSVTAALHNAGAEVEQTLETLGTIIATVDESRLDAVRSVSGVAHVERERMFHVAPPDSDVM